MRSIFLMFVCHLSLALATNAFAATISVPTDTVEFSFKTSATGKFGQGEGGSIAGGNSLGFTPDDFDVHAGNGRQTLSRTIRIDIRANDGFLISGFDLLQEGEFLTAPGGSASVSTRLKAVDHTNTRQRFTLADKEKFGGNDQGEWSLSLDDAYDKLIKPSSWLTLFITTKESTRGRRNLESWISLLSFDLNVTTISSGGTPVPLPGAFWTFLAACGVLARSASRGAQTSATAAYS